MVVPFGSLHYHVINIDLHISPNLMEKHDVHESLIGGTNILEARGHGIKVVVALIQHEGDFLGI